MRRIGIAALLLVVSIGAGVGLFWRVNARPAAYAPLGPGERYLALGDSLAAGFTVGAPAEAYVARLATALRQIRLDTTVTNLADRRLACRTICALDCTSVVAADVDRNRADPATGRALLGDPFECSGKLSCAQRA